MGAGLADLVGHDGDFLAESGAPAETDGPPHTITTASKLQVLDRILKTACSSFLRVRMLLIA